MNEPKPGDRIRLETMPPPVEASRDRFPETYDVFAKALGGIFTVRDVEHGMVELWVTAEGADSGDPCDDSIWVEASCRRPVPSSDS